MSSSELSDLLKEDYVKVRIKEILDSLVVKMDGVMRGYLVAVQNAILRYYGFKPVIEINSSMFDYGIEYRIILYIDPKDVKRIEAIARHEVGISQIRLRALRKLLAQALRVKSGEEDDLLSDLHSGSGEGYEKAGGG
jgi:hypothetical protein